ncbi:MAG: helix-turn-helix transcriptional regulator [Vicingaceae bacterium]
MKALKTYQTVNRQHTELNFGISSMESIHTKNQGKVDDPHRHEFYTMLLVKQARGIHKIDFKTYPLNGMEIFFISPGQVHQLIEETASEGYSIVFSIDFLLQNHIPINFINDLNLFRECGETPPLSLSNQQLQKLLARAEEMLTLYHSDEPMKLDSIGALLKLMLISCRQICDLNKMTSHTEVRKSNILKEFKALVETHYTEWHKSKQYASAINLSSDHLNRVVKELTGKTTKEHIQNRIIIAAKRLLFFSDLSFKEIAFELGFEEAGNFSAFFKNCTGQSPTEFVENH